MIVHVVSYYGGDREELPPEIKVALQKALDNRVVFYKLSHGYHGVNTSTLITTKTIEGKIYVVIPGSFEGYRSNKHNQGGFWVFKIDTNRKLVLITYEGQGEFYSHGQKGGWLIGIDDDLWVVRVPSTMTSIDEALEWLKPAEVKKAEKEGRQVVRQGDIFFIETKKRHINLRALEGTNHKYEIGRDKIIIKHPQHGILVLKGHNWKAVRNKAIERISGD